MTPANPDALVEALVDQIARILDLDAHHLGRPDYYGPEQILAFASARVRVARQKASAIIAGPLAPLLADLQQQAASISSLEESVNSLEADLQRVTAENARAEDERFAVAYTTARGAMDYEHMARVLSGRLRRMDRRAAAANRRADAAEARAAQLQAEVEAKDRRIALTNRVQAQLEVAQNALCKIDRGGKPMRDIAAQALLRIAMVPYPEEAAALARSAKEERTNA